MRYLLMIYTAEVDPSTLPADVTQSINDGYAAFTREIRDRGVMEAGEALLPTSSATTIRIRDGNTIVTDGPYAETKEALGGFYLLDVKDLDEAIQYAAKIPGAREGAIEVRPIWELPI